MCLLLPASIIAFHTHIHTHSQHIQASKARIGVSCKACGYQGVLDSRHKVTTFIINHPPNSAEDSSSKK